MYAWWKPAEAHKLDPMLWHRVVASTRVNNIPSQNKQKPVAVINRLINDPRRPSNYIHRNWVGEMESTPFLRWWGFKINK